MWDGAVFPGAFFRSLFFFFFVEKRSAFDFQTKLVTFSDYSSKAKTYLLDGRRCH